MIQTALVFSKLHPSKNMKPLVFSSFACLLAVLFSTQKLAAHGDELPTGAQARADHFAVYAQSDRYELTLYFPEIKAGEEARLQLFVADYRSNRPIEKADLKISTAENPQQVFEIQPITAGVYELRTTFSETKIYQLNVQIAHPNGTDLIGIQNVEVGKLLPHDDEHDAESHHSHEGEMPAWLVFLLGGLAGAAAVFFILKNKNRTLTTVLLLASAWFSTPNWNPAFAHGDDEHGAKSGGGFGKTVFAPKETQFLFEVLTQPIAVGDYHSATTMFGTVVPASGGLGAVVAPQSGRISAVRVVVGQSVRAGQVVAVLQQNLGTSESVGVAATNAGLDLQIENVRVRLAAAQREMDRLKKIEDIAAGKDLAAAEANLAAARAELSALENRAVGANSSANARSVALVAPISGVVGAFTLAAGEEVAAGQTLLTVTNINKVYVEAQVYDRDLAAVQVGNKFLVTCSTDDHKTAEVRLISQAQTMNTGNQSQRVLFEMDNPQGDFKIGEFVSLKALQAQTNRQISVPNSALTEINGRTAVFLKHAPEEFELAYVQTGEDDGVRTLILKGLDEDEKVVVGGAYEVKMMYLNQ
jgi:RND family efflux transporter MFP subunit